MRYRLNRDSHYSPWPFSKFSCLLLFLICSFLSACNDSSNTNEQSKSSESPKASSPRGFFGEMQSSDAFTSVERNTYVELPEDHKSHPDFQLEWWYLTFVLSGEDGQEFGLQYTLFRFNTDAASGKSTYEPVVRNWANGQQWMGHASLHTLEHHYFEERFANGGVGNAYVKSAPFTTVIDDWVWKATQTEPESKATEDSKAMFPSTLTFAFGQQHTRDTNQLPNATSKPTEEVLPRSDEAQNGADDRALPADTQLNNEVVPMNKAVKVALNLNSSGPFIKQGDNGYSKKTQDERLRSYYYSQPFINAKGTMNIEGNNIKVEGKGWFDHEWTSHLANSEALGWDWFSLHLNDGSKLMAFRMHANTNREEKSETKNTEVFTTASYINKNGMKENVEQANLSITPTGYELIQKESKQDGKQGNEHDSSVRSVPTAWRIQLPTKNIDISVSAFKEKQWNNSLFPYFEGRVEVEGSHSGSGFMELTGY
ncbi:lipocalin-like domain-containing protein [Alteromonas macleodii]|uniref:Putative secreted hydrolase n=1 Tax=Alteromonas macleodii TaxID=28108 RepID=A0A6T9Y243_ALTMA|nr:lipocalin-like domain-containing protein [Alteromonas macleodii]CAB9494784.1 putative secreted hydrolase [Alteromonas macleodii]